ncbi:MAG: hypothetical protein K2X27_11025 [Candidatus Obscuribacterales bacterium]|nr:hypothetical protein [Candidatus Obscuribacterales bacterium]
MGEAGIIGAGKVQGQADKNEMSAAQNYLIQATISAHDGYKQRPAYENKNYYETENRSHNNRQDTGKRSEQFDEKAAREVLTDLLQKTEKLLAQRYGDKYPQRRAYEHEKGYYDKAEKRPHRHDDDSKEASRKEPSYIDTDTSKLYK